MKSLTKKIFSLMRSVGLTAMLIACSGGGGDVPSSNSGSNPSPIIPPPKVATGKASQTFMTLVADKYNLNWNLIGDKAKITVFVADTAGNPVDVDTPVYFSTSAGQVLSSCKLTGDTSTGSNISSCSVDFVVQSPLSTPNGLVRIIAWLEGQEAFTDLNGNGQYDTGEPFFDSGIPFRDDNQNRIYDAGIDQLVIAGSKAAGSSMCGSGGIKLDFVPYSVPNTCDGQWGNGYVSGQITFAQSDASNFNFDNQVNTAQVRSFSNTSAGNKIAPPNGAKLTVLNAPTGCTITINPDTVPVNATVDTPFIHNLITTTQSACVGKQVQFKMEYTGYTPVINTLTVF
jgi:hypothetical protein